MRAPSPRHALRRCAFCLLLAGAAAGCARDSTVEGQSAPRVFRAQPFGARLPVRSESGLTYIVTASPGGPRAAVLEAVDANGVVLASDASSGPLGLPRLAVPPGTRFVVIGGAGEQPRGVLNVYANDTRDDDGDGVGRALERALGTCDRADDPHCARSALAAYYERVRRGTRDTDRDGLSDGDELWGVAGQPTLDLPRFGADPLHKDVFVEVDRARSVAAPGLSEDDLVQVASLFAHGSAAALRNPDGLPGIRMHFDIGFEPADARHRSLLGNWGGSGRGAGNYKKARKRNFTAVRAGYFRYAVLVRSGFGQSSGDAFVVNRDHNRVALFAHELAHTLGLKHHGAQAWGAVNCKPNHFSIINYAYQNMLEVGFSTRAGSVLNPSAVFEQTPVDATTATLLRGIPFELDVTDSGPRAGVDWNRDGRISDEPVRAGVTWATHKSCEAAGFGRTTLAEPVQAASPALAAVDGDVHAFWIDGQGKLAHRSAHARACDGGRPERCTQLGPVSMLDGYEKLRAIATAPAEQGHVVLADVAIDGSVRLSVVRFTNDGPRASGPVEIPGASSQHAPAVAWTTVDRAHYGVTRVLTVLFVAGDADGTLMQASASTPEGPFVVRPALDGALRPIRTPLAPAIATLGTDDLCGAFADEQSMIRFHCYDASFDLWRDHSAQAFYAGLGPRTGGPVGLAYHRYRASDGSPLDGDETRGALYLSFTEPAPSKDKTPDSPQLMISEWLDAASATATSIRFRWRGNVINQWTHLAANTSLVLHEDSSLPALTGAMVMRSKDGLRLELLPFVDGSFDLDLGSGDDFEVMERGICAQLRGVGACGGRDTGRH
jgi:hypothetical protein